MLNWAEKSTMQMIAGDVMSADPYGFFYKEIYLQGISAMPHVSEDAVMDWVRNWQNS